MNINNKKIERLKEIDERFFKAREKLLNTKQVGYLIELNNDFKFLSRLLNEQVSSVENDEERKSLLIGDTLNKIEFKLFNSKTRIYPLYEIHQYEIISMIIQLANLHNIPYSSEKELLTIFEDAFYICINNNKLDTIILLISRYSESIAQN